MIHLTLKTLCLILAAVCFLFKALGIPVSRLDLVALGFFFVTLWVLV